MSTRQTLKNYLSDRGISGVGTVSYNVSTVAGDSSGAVDEGDDLSFDPNTGKRLVNAGTSPGLVPDYLSYTTQESGNTYPIDASSYKTAPSPVRGTALEAPEVQGATDVFVSSDRYPAKPNYFEGSGNPLGTVLDKIGDGSVTSGPDLITSVRSSQFDADVIRNQSKAVTAPFMMLKKYNKYADAQGATDPRFVEPNTDGGADTSSTFDDAVTLGFQRSPGEFLKGDTATSRQIPLSDMHEVAHSMLLKAAGWDKSTTAFTSENPQDFFNNFDDTRFQLYPSIIGTLFPDQVRPRESYGAPTVGENSLLAGAGEAVPRDGSDAKYTVASTNSYTPDVTFAPMTLDEDSQGILSVYQAGISIVGLSILLQNTINRMPGYTKNGTDMQNLGLGPYYMGLTSKAKAEPSLRAVSGIALINTGRFAFEECVRAGVILYFGIDITSFDTVSTATMNPAAIKTISGPEGNKSTQDRLAQSYGFWRSVAKSCVNLMSMIERSLESLDSKIFADAITMLLQSKALRITNVFAQIGYTYLIAHLEEPTKDSQQVDPQTKSKKLTTPFSIDSFESLPGTRVMKSRDQNSRSALSLAWRHGSIPSALLLPPALIQATLDMDNIFEGPNPVKQLMGTTLQDKTYVSTRNIGRIPIEVVNNLENRLDAEYVPFYFHDLRTNEIVAFHAFLDSLTDNYSTQYTSTQAYGRADAVKNYNNTKRSIGFSFMAVSTSEEDFDEMWVKINKLVTLMYPQYTKGVMNVASNVEFNGLGGPRDFKFEQPFSQVLGASPLVRLRIGDVIKSNYSRFNLGRLFGAGNTDAGALKNAGAGKVEKAGNILSTGAQSSTRSTTLTSKNVFSNALLLPLLLTIASPAELALATTMIKGAPKTEGFARSVAFDVADNLFKNGFVNPILPGLIRKESTSDFLKSIPRGKIFLKPRAEPYVFTKDKDKVYVKITRPLEVNLNVGNSGDILDRVDPDNPAAPIPALVTLDSSLQFLGLQFSDSFIYPQSSRSILENGATCEVTLDQCLFDPDGYFSATVAGLMILGQGLAVQGLASQALQSGLSDLSAASGISLNTGLVTDLLGSFMRQFTSHFANPITYAIEDSMSRGLAGVLTSMNFTWIDPGIPWETRWNSRAPMACKISLNFDPIHDISPGLDVYGANRAPNYNVGSMRLIAGDPHRDGGLKSKSFFDRSGKEGSLYLKSNS